MSVRQNKDQVWNPWGTDACCENCRYFNEKLDECRRHAPHPYPAASRSYPSTLPYDWCGDYERLVVVVVDQFPHG